MPLIMIIDDDDDLRDALAEGLEFIGYPTMTAFNGRDALTKLHAGNRPSLILLDLMMPVMNGFEFLREQQRNPELAQIPIVVLTAAGKIAENLEATGVAAVLHKPVTLEEIESAIKKWAS